VTRTKEQRNRKKGADDATHRRDTVPELQQADDDSLFSQLLGMIRKHVHEMRPKQATTERPGQYVS